MKKKHTTHMLVFAGVVISLAWIGLWVGVGPADLAAGPLNAFAVNDGDVWIAFNVSTLEEFGWSVTDTGGEHVAVQGEELALSIDPTSDLRVRMREGYARPITTGTLTTRGALLLTGLGLADRVVVGNLTVELRPDGPGIVTNTLVGPHAGCVVFELSSIAIDASPTDRSLRIVADVSMAGSWAKALGVPGAGGIRLGMMTIDARFDAGAGAKSPRDAESWDGTRETALGDSAAGEAAEIDEGTVAFVDGSDVVVGDLQSVLRHGRVGNITAFSVGTNACNLGNRRASWIASTNQHPLIFGAMFRLMDGRFEQIGMSWVKHGFYAVQQSLCTPCADPVEGGQQLGVGCSDPYSAYLNGVQSNNSLRSDVNAHTGYFPYPPPSLPYSGTDPTPKRLQVRDADLDPDLNPGAWYFVEGHYIHPNDSDAGTQNNNASYRRVAITEQSPNYFLVTVTGVTQRQQPGIRAWRDTDSAVAEVDVPVPGEGLFILAAKVTDLGNGFWHYEYAMENLNSDRSAGSLSIPLPRGAVVQNIGFRDVDYHSGEIYDLTDWPATVVDWRLTWATQPYNVNPNANALRFGTLYNFRFDANVGPGPTVVTIGLFKPGAPSEIAARIAGPSLLFLDCNNNGIADACDIECGGGCDPPCGGSADCNDNDTPDECEPDCNANGIADECDIRNGSSHDCNQNTVPDECEPDCDGDGIPDECDTLDDTDRDGIYDCFDRCPLTTPSGACVCPPIGRCCCTSGFCLDGYPRLACIEIACTPDCVETPCRDGCLIGDLDGDGDRDLADIARLQRCYTGVFGSAGFLTPSAECTRHFDFDEDDDIDLTDFSDFRAELAGPD